MLQIRILLTVPLILSSAIIEIALLPFSYFSKLLRNLAFAIMGEERKIEK